jgi:hypothetical protein
MRSTAAGTGGWRFTVRWGLPVLKSSTGMQDSLQMGAVPHEHPVQALGADRAHEPFGHRGRPRR